MILKQGRTPITIAISERGTPNWSVSGQNKIISVIRNSSKEPSGQIFSVGIFQEIRNVITENS